MDVIGLASENPDPVPTIHVDGVLSTLPGVRADRVDVGTVKLERRDRPLDGHRRFRSRDLVNLARHQLGEQVAARLTAAA
ncbi:hypothetical protein D3C71_1763300 [compost metagenome]